jgi:hypothetical protein
MAPVDQALIDRCNRVAPELLMLYLRTQRIEPVSWIWKKHRVVRLSFEMRCPYYWTSLLLLSLNIHPCGSK